MGLFTRKDKVKRAPKQQSPSLVKPPNVFAPDDAAYDHGPQIPPRPATAARSSDRRLLPYHQRNASTPQLARPAGYLTAPHDHQNHGQHQHHCGPVIVNQHYYINSQPSQSGELVPSHDRRSPYSNPGKSTRSVANLARDLGAAPNCSDGFSAWAGYSANLVSSTVNACDEISHRLNHVLTMIDGEHLRGNEMDLFSYRHPVALSDETSREEYPGKPPKKSSRNRDRDRDRDRDRSRPQTADATASVVRGNYFSKVQLYANSKLPPRSLAPFAV